MSEPAHNRFPLPDGVYQVRVSLIESEPLIWRRLLVNQEILLPRLHTILQVAMGWEDSHLHQFKVGDLRFAEPDDESLSAPIDYRRIALNQILPRRGSSCVYEYDFGDSWDHLVELEEELPRENVTHPLPRCVDGARACPPEDSGGVHHYELLLAATADPKHPEHEEYRGCIGTDFDPEAFDIDDVNRKLTAHASPRRRRTP